jgi:hypothetical protein
VGERSQDTQSTSRRRSLLGLAASAVAVVAGAVVLWQVLSEEPRAMRGSTSAGGPVEIARTPFPDPKQPEPRRGRGQSEKTEGAESDRQRLRLPPGREFADGPTIARVIIPEIGVRAPMFAVGLNRDDSLRVPASTRKVGWWRGGKKAGRKGAAVIVGHVDSQSGPAVFYRLKELSPRARIKVVHNDGSQAQLRGHGSRAGFQGRLPDRPGLRRPGTADRPAGHLRGEFDEESGHYEDNVIVYGRAA